MLDASLGIIALHGIVQSCQAATIGDIDILGIVQQKIDHIFVAAILAGDDQRRITIIVRKFDRGTSLEQAFHAFRRTVGGSHLQRCMMAIVKDIHITPQLDKAFHHGWIVPIGSDMERLTPLLGVRTVQRIARILEHFHGLRQSSGVCKIKHRRPRERFVRNVIKSQFQKSGGNIRIIARHGDLECTAPCITGNIAMCQK